MSSNSTPLWTNLENHYQQNFDPVHGAFFLWFSLSVLPHYIRSTVPVVVGNNFYVVSHQDVSHTFNIRQSYLTRLDSVPASLGSYRSLPGSPPPPPYSIAIQELQLLQELLRQSEAKRSSVDNQRPENNSSVIWIRKRTFKYL